MADYAASYCERCGTRYRFDSGSSAGAPLRDARVLAKGLKYFVTSNSASMGEAMAYARMDVQSKESSRVSQQFHKTFNFCMTCRQYACDNCWNEAQGACLSCAPESGFEPVEPTDLLLVRTPASRLEPGPAGLPHSSADAPGSASTRPGMPAWPAQDLPKVEAPLPDGYDGTAEAMAAESVRQESRNLWPIQDDLDGERMDLTPDELALIEGQLGHMAPHAFAEPAEALEPAEEPAVAEAPVAAEALEPAEAPVAAEEPAAAEAPVAAEALEPGEAPVAAEALEPAEAPEPAEARVAPFAVVPLAASPGDTSEHPAEPWPNATPWSVRTIHSGGHVLGLVPMLPTPAESPDELVVSGPVPADEALLPELGVDWEPVAASTEGPELVVAEPTFIAEPEYVAAPELPAEPEYVAAPELPAEPEYVAAPELVAEPAFVAEPEYVAAPELPAEPAFVAEPASPAGPIDAEPLIQQPLFVPAVSADRWAATARPPEPDAPRKPADLPASWQPLGAIWPAPKSPEFPWQGPDPSSLPAAVVAAQQVARPTGPAIWADSSQEVMSRGNVRACHHCALPVSTHARFCRRCGTQQV